MVTCPLGRRQNKINLNLFGLIDAERMKGEEPPKKPDGGEGGGSGHEDDDDQPIPMDDVGELANVDGEEEEEEELDDFTAEGDFNLARYM